LNEPRSHQTDPIPKHIPIVITIDGPAGTGKSTIAHRLAERLGLDYLDTGAMYRGAALIALEANLDLNHGKSVTQAFVNANLRFDWSTKPPRLLIDNPDTQDITERIREVDVTTAVTPVSALSELRAVMRQRQRAIRQDHPRLITEGRDQGSAVFDDAPIKFYLDAEPDTRAKRRVRQLRATGQPADEADTLAKILNRDEADRTRKDGPLIVPDDAIVFDTTHLTREQVTDTLEEHVRDWLQTQ